MARPKVFTARMAQDVAIGHMSPRTDAINIFAQTGKPTVDLPREVYADIQWFKRDGVASQYSKEEYETIMWELDQLHGWACNYSPKCCAPGHSHFSCGKTGYATDEKGEYGPANWTYCDSHWHDLTGE